MNKKKASVFGAIVLLIGLFYFFDLGQYFNLSYLKSQQENLAQLYVEHPWRLMLLYMLGYIAVTSLSLPGATLMTLVGGAVFGLLWGTVLVSFASTIGATFAFLVSRFLLRDLVQAKFSEKLEAIDQGIRKDGAFYLFTLRLVPIFPFFIINLALGLTAIRTFTYFWVSQLGMFPATVVYVNAGIQLAKIESLDGILSPSLILSFALLGVFPFLARKIVSIMKNRMKLRKFEKPKVFDKNIVVIGAGAGGLVSAYIGAAVQSKVALIEKNIMGGECLNVGCVPSKALIRSAKFVADVSRAKVFGMKSADVQFDFSEVMQRVRRVIETIAPHDSIERYEKLGVECIQGEAIIKTPYLVAVNGRDIATRNIIIASGGRPLVPDIPGMQNIQYLTSDTVWDLRALPERIIVLGGGPIGCELAQCFARFGSKVTIVQRRDRILPREDIEFSEIMMRKFRQEGIDLRLNHRVQKVCELNGEKSLVCDDGGQEVRLPFDEILIAVGRVPSTKGFGLEELNIPVSESGFIEVNEYLQTSYPNIYACGDVAGPFQFTHTAAHQAWYCAVNALFGSIKKFRVDYSVIPWATFTDPEVARVGLNEQEAIEKGVAYEVTTYDIGDLDRAIVDEHAVGLVKVLTVPGKDKILGVTIAGEHAGDLIAEYVAAMRHGFGLNKILGTIHIYPTLAEANKFAAGEWKRAHVSPNSLRWLNRFHAWMRG